MDHALMRSLSHQVTSEDRMPPPLSEWLPLFALQKIPPHRPAKYAHQRGLANSPCNMGAGSSINQHL